MPSKPWVRLYTEVPDDPKVQNLSGELFKFWINCLCLAGRNDGLLPDDGELVWRLRTKPAKISSLKQRLIDAGLIDETPEGRFTPHGWDGRQYVADVSTSRVKQFRERSLKQDETVSRNRFSSVCSVSVSEKEEKDAKIHFDFPEHFQELWELYPAVRRTKRVDSERLYVELLSPLPDEERLAVHEAILAPLRLGGKWAESADWAKGFISALSEYIRNKRWNEEPAQRGRDPTKQPKPDFLDQAAAAIEERGGFQK